MSASRITRPLILGAVALALVSAGGCSWMKGKDKVEPYQKSTESRPLEVPPDLTVPDTSAATTLPAASLLGGPRATTSAGFLVDGDAKAVWARVGKAIEGVSGATITGRAEAITSYDVSYEGQSFLVRVESAVAQSRISALSPDGMPLTQGPGAKLLAEVQKKL